MAATPDPAGPDSTNWEKFQTQNPVVRRLIERFYGHVRTMVASLAPEAVLDAGCGEGETLGRLSELSGADLYAVDLSEEAVEHTRLRIPGVSASVDSVYALPFADEHFDLVFCLEVLEHLTEPERALRELRRVARSDLILSVPHEPWFRFGSALRGKYLRTMGNHPEHVNHWSSRSFRSFLERDFSSVDVRRSLPWLIAHCRR